jgi:hypothetical protein
MGCCGSTPKDEGVVLENKQPEPQPKPSSTLQTVQPQAVKVEIAKPPEPTKAADAKAKKDEKRRAGVSAETGDQGSAGKPAKSTLPPKTDEQKQMIASATEGNALFEGLNEAQMKEIVDHMEEKTYAGGDVVITQGEQGDNFYVVSSGAYAAFLKQVGDKPVKQYAVGGAFGELALMYNCPRAATVKCMEPGSLWALDRTTFRSILMSVHKEELDSNAQVRTAACRAVGPRTPPTSGAAETHARRTRATHGGCRRKRCSTLRCSCAHSCRRRALRVLRSSSKR